jgi:A/G-specific adenine glycosylase
MTSSDEKIKFFQTKLLGWFETNGRNFLWRKKSTSNFVKIISEVLLQRTKAETVNKFLPIFLNSYPDWISLGNATEVELVNILKPLGLSNQRGKRLHKLAQELKSRNWKFPKDRPLVEEMPMMGQYITNAYELFILKRPSPLLDVNMARVLERFFGPRKLVDIRYDPYLLDLSTKVASHQEIVKINWAILDFATLICKTKSPSCLTCLLKRKCSFYQG